MTTEAAASPEAPGQTCLGEQQVRDILRQVVDPEVGMNIVALGLVYRIEVAPDRLLIEMTMTSPACPMGEMIVGDVRAALKQALPDAIEPDIRLVWEPPWNSSMMDEASKQHFGWAPD
ncbi:MAG: metal-sulfur cluster assembly factor [Rhodocyclales bacterium]|nr:metal-sulfur cluster assembly factor [Rhodocyclales bacterium]